MKHLIGESDRSGTDEREQPTRRRSLWWDIAETLLIALVLFVVIRGIVLNYRVDGSSMEPTLHNGEMLLVNRRAYMAVPIGRWLSALPMVHVDAQWVWYPFGEPSRGDIVVFRPPSGGSEPYVKRIIGLPGEHVEIRNGSVYINGKRLIEPYLTEPTMWRGMTLNHEYVVEPGHVFVMGDNRNNSSDSRVFGAVPMSAIIGKAWLTYWPPDEAKLLSTPAYALE
ncbi:MAG: signal peptidase I [Thermomicrobium sp.]|nr:signal peptidase I [Thermomicrobium sp.]MDW7981743.1 signal peptidase I [Thermomicrobium sp.]